MNSVDVGFSGAASGINNAASRVAGLVAVAVFGVIMSSIFARSLHDHLERTGLAPPVIETIEQQRSKLAAIDLPPGMSAQETTAAKDAVAFAFVTGFRWIMLLSAVIALASAASAWLLIGNARDRPPAGPGIGSSQA